MRDDPEVLYSRDSSDDHVIGNGRKQELVHSFNSGFINPAAFIKSKRKYINAQSVNLRPCL